MQATIQHRQCHTRKASCASAARVPQVKPLSSNLVFHSSSTGCVPSHRLRAASEDGTAPVAAPEPQVAQASAPVVDDEPEVVFYEGSGGSNVELAISILLSATLVYAPLTIASIGRRLWINYKFTNKRLIVTNTSPLFKNEVQISYDRIKEVLSVPRAFGTWGDMVIVLKDGARLEILGFEKYADVKAHIEKCKWTLKA